MPNWKKVLTSGSAGELSSLFAPSITGSLLGTASFATSASRAISSSRSDSALSASFATTASYILNAISSSFASTASSVNTLNQNVLITGSLTVGATAVGANENTLIIGPAPVGGAGEGGQILLQAVGGTYTSASMLDNYQNRFRILRGTNASSDAEYFNLNLHSGQVTFNKYTGSGAFSGTAAGYLAFDSSGNILTTAGVAASAGGSNTQIQYNNGGALGGVSTLTFDGTTLRATGSFTGSFTGSLFGTASWSDNAVSASFASTASFITASNVFGPYGSNSVATASYAIYAETASRSNITLATQILVLNQSGYTINKGLVVHITASGNSSDIPRIVSASYESDSFSANTLGISVENISDGSQGYVITEGVLTGIDTSLFQSGQLIYLGAQGTITGSAPVAPLHSVRLGQVIREQSVNGSIHVRVDNGYELGELHDTLDTTTSASYGDLLVKSGSVWTNSRQLTGSYGLTGSLSATSFTGSLFGTASWAQNAISSSFASTASFLNSTTNAFIQGGNSFGTTATLGTNDNQNLALETNGTTRITIVSSSGNVGIGTTTPGALLHVQGNDKFVVTSQTSYPWGNNTTIGVGMGTYSTYNAGAIDFRRWVGSATSHSVAAITQELSSTGWGLAFKTDYPGTNTTASSTRMYISTAGNVGVGITTPSASLHINNTTSGNSFLVEDSTNPDTTPFIIDAAGQVGIGTTTPATKLHVSHSSAEIARFESNASTGNAYVSFYGNGVAKGYVGYGSPSNNGLFLTNYLSDAGASLSLGTNGTARLTISSSGQVGIGTTTPRETLGIAGTGMRLETSAGSEAGTVRMTSFHSTLYMASNLYYSGSAAPESNSYYILDSGSNNRSGNLFYIKTNAGGAPGSSGFYFFTATASSGANTLATLTEQFRIVPGTASFSNNNVGIGTTAPTQKLTVAGGSILLDNNTALKQKDASGTELDIVTLNAGNSLYLGSGQRDIYFRAGNNNIVYVTSSAVGIGTSSPTLGTLQVAGNVYATSFTGSMQGTASWANKAITASHATSISALNQNVVVTGSLTVTNDLTILGSASIQYITSSQLNIFDNIISVNTLSPSIRFGGLAVIDSGSSPQQSGSLLFDSQNNQWIFTHQSAPAAAVTSSVLIMGPQTFNNIGGETGLTTNRLPKGAGVDLGEHLTDSNITDTGTLVSINSNSHVTGSLIVTAGITGSLFGTGSWAVNAVTASTVLVGDVGLTAGLYYPTFVQTNNIPKASAELVTDSSLAYDPLNNILYTTASLANTASYVNPLNQDVIITGSVVLGNVQDPMLLTTTITTTVSTGFTTLYSLPTASYDTAFFEYSARSGSNARAGSMMAIRSGSAVNFTETTTIDFGSTDECSLDVLTSGGNMILRTNTSTVGWTIKTIVRSI